VNKMSEQLKRRKERIFKFLKWLHAKERTIYECKEWLFMNYALSTNGIDNVIKQCRQYGLIRFQGGKMSVNVTKMTIFSKEA